MPSSLRILHLVGSVYNDFYCDLSYRYAEGCLENIATVSLVQDFQIAYITPDGQWRFSRSLSPKDIDAANPMSLSDAIQFIKVQKIDLMIPHMYCIPGVTHYRALFDLLHIPYIGNSPDVMALTAHKVKTKAIVAAVGVKVPDGELLRQGDVPTILPPVIVKPANADNSLGVSLVKNIKDYDVALKNAFKHADEVLVERFIEPGREVRCSIIVKDGQLIALPLEEYRLDSEHQPIRSYDDKFPELDSDGKFIGYPEDDIGKHWIVDRNDSAIKKVQEMAKKCHLALGCRHYSLFEFRIDPNGEPWFLEAGLFCSFGDGGGISLMAKTAGISLEDLLKIMIKEAMNNA
ncbi:hypothetical protein I4U23_023127 [Adineta vaga]|nr:hypothetical protein I4U23_023127 [Adineta vaga]